MKILVISHEYPPIGGGGANACYYLTRGYVQKGHEVTLVTVWYEGLEEHEVVDGVEIFRVKSKRAHKEHCSFEEMLSYIVKALPLADKLQKTKKYDICQVFFGIPSGPIGYWLKKKYKLPYIIRFGGGDIPGFQDRFKNVYKLIGPAVKIIWKNAEALVANSEGLRQFAMDFYSKKEISIINNGVDTSRYYPDESLRDKDAINLLFVSRLIERKGLQHIIPILNQINTDKKVTLTIVGDGPYRENLEGLVKEHQVEDKVRFAGQKDKTELLPYYQEGDMFIFPSKREGMPNAVLEAMACGLPIIMTNCEGSKELIEGNGRIAKTEEFLTHINDYVSNEDVRIRDGKQSVNIVVERFSWDKITQEYIELMESVI